jgi:hypothetical protein
LPPALTRGGEKVDEGMGFNTEVANPMPAGQRTGMQ